MQGPEDKTRLPDEARANASPFSVRIANPTKLFRAIQKDYTGEIGKLSLPELSGSARVEVKCSDYYDAFNIQGSIVKDASANDNPSEFLNLLISLKKKYPEMSEKKYPNSQKVFYVLQGQNGTFLRLSQDGGIQLELLKGRTQGFENRTLISDLKKDSFGAIAEDFTQALQAVIRSTYEVNGKTLPQKNFVLSVPKFKQEISVLKFPLPRDLEGKVDLEVPNVSFEDIGGQEEAKKELLKVSISLDQPDLYRLFGTRPPKGVLLYGPPGTGKTLLARALAAEGNAFFLSVSLSEITSKYYGETEKIVRGIFDWAAKIGKEKPTILFFDEIDSIAMDREDAHEATQRALATFLTAMSGFQEVENVIVIGATNRMEKIDKALLRPGRFDRKIHVGLPDEEGLKGIFKIGKRQVEEDSGNKHLFSEDIDLDMIVSKMKAASFSGADVVEVFRRAQDEKVYLKWMGEPYGQTTTEDFLSAIEGCKEEKTAKENKAEQVYP
ncbi:MAG: AAA family ATPase [Candidatus Levybacteria bacterium]|nr:AAA family ATPase [Candidatus Levybacteria bacterium]